jgi:hypothetical protein
MRNIRERRLALVLIADSDRQAQWSAFAKRLAQNIPHEYKSGVDSFPHITLVHFRFAGTDDEIFGGLRTQALGSLAVPLELDTQTSILTGEDGTKYTSVDVVDKSSRSVYRLHEDVLYVLSRLGATVTGDVGAKYRPHMTVLGGAEVNGADVPHELAGYQSLEAALAVLGEHGQIVKATLLRDRTVMELHPNNGFNEVRRA